MQLGDYGQYVENGVSYDSNTAELKNGWGTPPYIEQWKMKLAVKGVIRECKAQGRIISQADALLVAERAIQAEQEKSTGLGKRVHSAAFKFSTDQPINKLDPYEMQYFEGFLRCYRRYRMNPVLAEKRLYYHLPDGRRIATQPDYIGPVDGILSIVNYKTGRNLSPDTGLQLACEMKLARENGYPVEKAYAMHIQPGFAYLMEFNSSWEDYLIVYNASSLKKIVFNQQPFTREDANEDEETADPQSESTALDATEAPLPAQASGIPGHQLRPEEEELSPTYASPDGKYLYFAGPTYLYQEGKGPDETAGRESQPVPGTHKRPRGRPRKTPFPETSLQQVETRVQSPTEVELDPRILKRPLVGTPQTTQYA